MGFIPALHSDRPLPMGPTFQQISTSPPLRLKAASFFFALPYPSREREAPPIYLHHDCPNTTLFTPSSTYQANLDTLISSLSSAATNSTDVFANATTGQNPPDQAYGLFRCRGDVSAATCSDCVSTGKQENLERCPNQRVSVIWYNECMLRYSNRSIFSSMTRSPDLVLYDMGNITDPTQLMKLLGETLKEVVARASAGGLGKKVATAEANFTSSQKLYALAECTPDLTASECVECLQFGIAILPQGKQGGRVLIPSCDVRYQLYPFYNASALPTPASPPPAKAPPPPAPANGPKGTCMFVSLGKSNKPITIIITVGVPIGECVLLFISSCCFSRRKATKTHIADLIEMTKVESLQYDLATIRDATDNFSNQNKLSVGGFGDVFKGMLPNGQEIAVKRLSQGSQQGDEEFKNEVKLLVKLQYRNLVWLIGFYSEDEEKLFAYEFIIHRDLKPSNILLDSEMTPKICDFIIARIFEINQSRANTRKIVGTIGYIAPEYATRGQFSMKSDVYSFSVVLLELVSGKKNSSFYQADVRRDCCPCKHRTPLAMLDPAVRETYSEEEVLKCLEIGWLCTQEDQNKRPAMATAVRKLNSHLAPLELSQQPAFYLNTNSTERPMAELEPMEE
ncbi:hypothetical protein EUGRSUZ_E04160, partial [Eucalyptus grandis]